MKRFLLAFVLSVVVGASAYAANLENPVEGRIKAIYSDFITVTIPSMVQKSPDVSPFPSGDLDIKVNAETVYGEDLGRLTDLKKGDRVEITYDIFDNNKVAKRINRLDDVEDIGATSVTTTKTTVTTTTVDQNPPSSY